MSIKERRERDKKQMRLKILHEATHIISSEGYEALTIRKLARRIEYSPRTIYLYFRDKEELISSIVEQGFAETWKRMSGMTDTDGIAGMKGEVRKSGKAASYENISISAVSYYSNRAEALRNIIAEQIRGHIRMGLSDPERYRVVVMLVSRSSHKPGPNQQKVEEAGKMHLAEYTGKREEDELNLRYDVFLWSLRGITLNLVSRSRKLSEDEIDGRIEAFKTMILDGLLAPPEGQ